MTTPGATTAASDLHTATLRSILYSIHSTARSVALFMSGPGHYLPEVHRHPTVELDANTERQPRYLETTLHGYVLSYGTPVAHPISLAFKSTMCLLSQSFII